MRFLYHLIVCATLWSCNPCGISFSKTHLTSATENCEKASCAKVVLDYPKSNNTAINTLIEDTIIGFLKTDTNTKTSTISSVIEDFKQEFLDFKNDFPETTLGYEALIEGKVTLEHPKLIAIEFSNYQYTGGAHGYGAIASLNINPKTAKPYTIEELFTKDFLAFAEKKFRFQENIPQALEINATGYWFENDVFYIPETILFSKEKIALVFNPYEISSYAEGHKIIEIPMQEALAFLKVKLL